MEFTLNSMKHFNSTNMIKYKKNIVSEKVFTDYFACDLNKCKGACCEEGDLGAPLNENEIKIIEKNLHQITPFMSTNGKNQILKTNFFERTQEHGAVTQTINSKECVFAVKNKNNFWSCSIEQAHNNGKINFKKPISCHLYPIRISKVGAYNVINVHEWSICQHACNPKTNGNIKLIDFLKDALVRYFGIKWYNELKKIESSLP